MGRNFGKTKDYFYFQKIFGKTEPNMNINSNKTKYDKSSNKFKSKLENLQLPIIDDNPKLQKGETEKILNYQFYKSSYKACFELNKESDAPNSSVQKNFRNNWKLVEKYANELKNRKNVVKERNQSLNLDNKYKKAIKISHSNVKI